MGVIMIDQCKRNIDYVRISVTDRCNMRCIYCMPEEGIAPLHHEDILTYDEIVRLCRCFITLGINKIKLTGGEPLVRKDIANLIRQIKSLEGIKSVTMTTNGVLLKEQLPDLIKAGLDGVNISLDTLNPVNFQKITRMDALQKVLEALEESLKYEELKVKINCVPMEDTDSTDIIRIAGLAKSSRLSVRFIEMMPIGFGKNYSFYGEDKIIKILEEAYGPLKLIHTVLGNGPAHYYAIEGFEGKIGFISALTHEFCGDCNRVRLTSDGYLKTCLHYSDGRDLKSVLRKDVKEKQVYASDLDNIVDKPSICRVKSENTEDSILQQVIRQTIYDKPVSHNFNKKNQHGTSEQGKMSQIGG